MDFSAQGSRHFDGRPQFGKRRLPPAAQKFVRSWRWGVGHVLTNSASVAERHLPQMQLPCVWIGSHQVQWLNKFTRHLDEKTIPYCAVATSRPSGGKSRLAVDSDDADVGNPLFRGLASFSVPCGFSASLPFFGLGMSGSLFDARPSAPKDPCAGQSQSP